MRIFSTRRSQGRPAHPDVLTPAEWRVLEQIRVGHTNQETAERLGISQSTVKTHVSNMLAKLDVEHRHQLAAWRGTPGEASQTALDRMRLTKAGWLGTGVATWTSRIAIGAGMLAVGAVFALAMQSLNVVGSSGGGPAEGPSAALTRTVETEPTPDEVSTPASGTVQDWRSALEGVPGLVALVDDILDSPVTLTSLLRPVSAVCSFHGELLAPCEERGLDLFDSFDAVPVSDVLQCEACSVAAEDFSSLVTHLYREGGFTYSLLWESAPVAMPAASPLPTSRLTLVGAWTLPTELSSRIAEQWPDRSPTVAIAVEATAPPPRRGVVTGLLLLVDPETPLPITNVEATTGEWSAFDTAQHLGFGAPLYDGR